MLDATSSQKLTASKGCMLVCASLKMADLHPLLSEPNLYPLLPQHGDTDFFVLQHRELSILGLAHVGGKGVDELLRQVEVRSLTPAQETQHPLSHGSNNSKIGTSRKESKAINHEIR